MTEKTLWDKILEVVAVTIWFVFHAAGWVLFLLVASCIANDFGGGY